MGRLKQRTPDHRLEARIDPPADPEGDRLCDQATYAESCVDGLENMRNVTACGNVRVSDRLRGDATLTISGLSGRDAAEWLGDLADRLREVATRIEQDAQGGAAAG